MEHTALEQNAMFRGAIEGRQPHASRLWGIVLAGGEGSRVQGFLKKVCGGRGIKQFCAVIGGRSMLQHTVARVERLIPRDRILVIVNAHHKPEVMQQLPDHPKNNIIFQPSNRETGPGVFLPLAHVSFRDPSATVAVFPSDHFVIEEKKFMTAVGKATVEADRHPGDLVLLGMPPNGFEEGYGWIEPEGNGHGKARPVRRFVEKPSSAFAQLLMARGAVWNTFVFTAKAATLWDMAQRAVPDLYHTFSLVRMMLASRHAPLFIEHVYETMRMVNFSSDVLSPLSSSLRVMPMPEVGWSDWGSVERICGSLKRIGKFDELLDRLRFSNIDLETQKVLARFCDRPSTKVPAATKPYRLQVQATG